MIQRVLSSELWNLHYQLNLCIEFFTNTVSHILMLSYYPTNFRSSCFLSSISFLYYVISVETKKLPRMCNPRSNVFYWMCFENFLYFRFHPHLRRFFYPQPHREARGRSERSSILCRRSHVFIKTYKNAVVLLHYVLTSRVELESIGIHPCTCLSQHNKCSMTSVSMVQLIYFSINSYSSDWAKSYCFSRPVIKWTSVYSTWSLEWLSSNSIPKVQQSSKLSR